MSLIDSESRECLKSELELFTTPLTQTSIEKTGYVNVYPVTALQLNGPLEFVLAPSSFGTLYRFTKKRFVPEM